jgi:hypothetical protein
MQASSTKNKKKKQKIQCCFSMYSVWLWVKFGVLRWPSTSYEISPHRPKDLDPTPQACGISQLTPLRGQFLTYRPRPVRAPPWLRNCIRNRTKSLPQLLGLKINSNNSVLIIRGQNLPQLLGLTISPNY